MYDNLSKLLPDNTVSTVSFNGTSLDTKQGIARMPCFVRVRVTAVSGTSQTAAYKVQHSDDNSTWTDHTTCDVASVTAVGTYFIPVLTGKRYIRLVCTIGGTSPSFTNSAEIGFSTP